MRTIMVNENEHLLRTSYRKEDTPAARIPEVKTDELEEAATEGEEKSTRATDGVATFTQTIFNLVNVLTGTSMLTVPFVLRCAGMGLGLVLLTACAAAMCHTSELLTRCLAISDKIRTYPDIGEAAFGKKGRNVIGLFFCTEVFIICISFLIIVGDNMHHLFPKIAQSVWTLLGYAVILPITWSPNLSFLSYFSILGVLGAVLMLVALFIEGASSASQDPTLGGSYIHPQTIEWIGQWDLIPFSFGIVAVCFAGHPCYPPIYYSMKNPKRFARSTQISYSFTYLLYVTIGILGYLMYGEMTQKEVTLNFIDPSCPWISTLTTWLIALTPITKLPLALNAVAGAIENWTIPESWIKAQKRKHRIASIGIRSIILTVALAVAIVYPKFDRISSLVGALFAMNVSIPIPMMCYMKLCGDRISKATRMAYAVIIVVTFLMSILGTLSVFLSPEASKNP